MATVSGSWMECSARGLLIGKAGEIGVGLGGVGFWGIVAQRNVCLVFKYPAGIR